MAGKALKIAIIANGRKAIAEIGKVTGKARSMGSRVSGALKGIAKTGAAAAIAAVGISLSKGFQRLNNIDVAKTKMKALGYSTKQTDKLMKSALKSVKGTSFGLDEAATAAASAAAAGIKQGKSMDSYLKMVANAASITGRSMTDMGAITNKVNTNSIASMAELNQINDAGIGITQGLAKHYGVTAGELRKMVSRGEVDAATFNKVLGDMVDGAAGTMGTTLPAIVANIWASAGRIGAAFLSKAFPAVKEGLGGILTGMDGFEDRATAIAEKVNAKFGTAWDKLRSIDLTEAKARLGELKDSALNAWDSIKSSLTPLKNTAENLWTLFGPLLEGLAKFVLGTAWAALKLALDGISKVVEPVADKLEKITDWAVKHQGKLKVAAIVIGGLLTPVLVGLGIAAAQAAATAGALLVYGAVSKVMGIGLKLAAAAQWLFNTAMLANPITWVVVGIIALISAIVLLVKHWDTVTAAIGKAWDWIKSKTEKVWNAVIEWVKKIPGKIASFFLNWSLPGLIIKHWETIKTKTREAIDRVIDWVKALPGRAVSAIGNLGSKLKNAGKNLIDGFLDGIKDKWNDVKDNLKKLTDKLPSWKGPAAKDKRLLKRPATLIMDGFIDQIQAKRKELKKALGQVTHDIATMGGTKPSLSSDIHVTGAAYAGAGGAGGTTVNITVNVPPTANPAEIGREIKRNLDAYYRAGGRA